MKAKTGVIGGVFLPKSSNNQKAFILQPQILSVLVAFFLTGQFFLSYFGLYFPRVLGYAANISPERLIQLTNQERARKGLEPLVNNPILNEVAQRKAGDMFALNYWAHNSPTGRTPWVFFKEVGYGYSLAGENLARDFDQSDEVVRAWMDSPSHKDNILNSGYQEIGLAVVNGTLEGVETTLVVQMFGTPTAAIAKVTEKSYLGTTLAKPALASGQATSSAWLGNLLSSVSSSDEEDSVISFSFFSLTKTMVVFLAGLVIGALVLDLVFVTRRKVHRIAGRSLAHLIFLVFSLLLCLATKPGLIL
ncbi:CAP domain-containing protein [Patescibacteria group bacterium]